MLPQALTPPDHTASASTSTLCKVLTWHHSGLIASLRSQGLDPCVLHQADWLASLLHGKRDTSDWNNALKVGFDPGAESYPPWLGQQVRAGRSWDRRGRL